MRSPIYNRVKVARALNVTAVSANGNSDGATISLDQSGMDCRSVTFVVAVGARTDGTYTPVPQESPDGSAWTNVPAARLIGSGAVSAAQGVAEVGVIPDPVNYPSVRLRVTATVVTTGASVEGFALLGEPCNYPIVRP